MTVSPKPQPLPNADKTIDLAPGYQFYAGGGKLGADWRETTPYLAVKLDDPSFAEPIRAALFENVEEQTGVLISKCQGRGTQT